MKSSSIPLFQRGKPQTNAPVPPFEKGGGKGDLPLRSFAFIE